MPAFAASKKDHSSGIKLASTDISALRKAFRDIHPKVAAICMGAAAKRAMAPAESGLKSAVSGRIVGVGPTGNLRRSVKAISRRYPKTGTGTAVVGFQKAGAGKSKSAAGGKVKRGPDRAFHQFWMEFGTKERETKYHATRPYVRTKPRARKTAVKELRKAGVSARDANALLKKSATEIATSVGGTVRVRRQGGFIASSFSTLGPFKFQGGKTAGVRTSPKSPKAFFKKSDRPVRLGSVPPFAPVSQTFEATKAQVSANLQTEMVSAVGKARRLLESAAGRRITGAQLLSQDFGADVPF
jgi:hypothetical protein